MEKNQWRREHFETGPDLKLFQARYDHMRNPRNGKVERMVILEAKDAVNVVALTPREEMLFVRQYRFGTQSYTLELPGGLVDEGEDHGAAARRELREETGATAEEWQFLGSIASNPVYMDNYIHHWLARRVAFEFEHQLDDGEDIELVRLPVAEVRRRWWAGEFQHPHTVSALLRFFALAEAPATE